MSLPNPGVLVASYIGTEKFIGLVNDSFSKAFVAATTSIIMKPSADARMES